jgi:hypothetical protein
MRRQYDIFEKFPDGTVIWRCCVFGQVETERKIQDLIAHSSNEFFAIELCASKRVVLGLVGGKLQPVVATPD